MKSKNVKNVIIITDIGMDPDDLTALILAYNSPEIKVDLVVSSEDSNGLRASMAKYTAEILNYKTKFVMGKELESTLCYFDSSKCNYNIPTNYVKKIDDVIKKNKHTYIISIGALTEFSKYLKKFEKNPLKMRKIRKKVTLVQMGGSDKYHEHNFNQNIEAAKHVFSNKISTNLITKEITNNDFIRNNNNSEFVKKVRESDSEIHEVLNKNIKDYFISFYFHDPLTLSTVINSNLITFKPMSVEFLPNKIQKFTYNKKSKIKISTAAHYNNINKLIKERVVDTFFEKNENNLIETINNNEYLKQVFSEALS